MKHKKRALFQSIMSLILCFSMLVGTTFAWFTDSVSSASNIIQSGRLDIEMHYSEDLTQDNGWKDASTGAIFNYEYWEPGYTDLKYLKIDNTGNLAFTYQLTFDLPEQTGGISNTESDGGEGETKTLESQNLEEGSQLAETVTPENSGNDDELLANMPDAQSGETGGEEVPPVQPAEPAKQNKQADALLLAKAIDVYYANVTGKILTREEATQSLTYVGTLSDLLNRKVFAAEGILLPEESLLSGNAELPAGVEADKGYTTAAIMLKMREDAGNEYMNLSAGNGFCLKVVATQYSYEKDAFGNDFDTEAVSVFPAFTGTNGAGINLGGTGTVETNEEGKVTTDTTIGGATIPQGTLVNTGVNELTVSISEKASSDANLTCGENEALRALDVHIEGVSPDNTVPIQVDLGQVLNIGLNQGNVTLYHVEDAGSKLMTQVLTLAELDAHNEFYYDPATGNVTVSMATFSEVTMLADTIPAWEGRFDYDWYTKAKPTVDGEPVTEYTIANADQLAAFGAIVGGMNGQTKDSFKDKTVKLIADINLGDKESENNPDLIFYPIGYYNIKNDSGLVTESSVRSFEGTFDGSGHTISNFYQNTWEMEGDYREGYSATDNYYKDAMGLFGYVLNGKVENLTVNNFSSDGEYAPTGVIAAYADGNSTFENIAITNCNPRVYNTGNGGIIGIAGDTNAANDDHIILKNITVDNSNKITALWGSWDVACGGLVGMYRGNVDGSGNATGDTIRFENCHVSAQIDVYNDVCANYQYYAYRYAGMIIGSVRHNTENADGKTIPNMTGISASGCTVNYGDWNDYYYCEFEKNTMASYSEDYQFSRVPHSELNFTDSNGNGVVDADERASVTGCKHDHTAEENHQAVYLPFHQLFTGYSWGVSSIGLKEYSGIVTDLDITEGDQQESVEKFETKFTGDFLYRVGNQNAVSVGSLFAAIEGANINSSSVVVSIDKVDENSNVSGTFTANTSDWTKGTIQFSGTGVVKVTIQDYNFCTPTELYLEVVDAKNHASEDISSLGNGNVVLLCNTKLNTNGSLALQNASLYGNNFEIDVTAGKTTGESVTANYLLYLNNGILDNVQLKGAVYTNFDVISKNSWNNPTVLSVGGSKIVNSQISNCASPVRVRGGNLEIINSTLRGGFFANLDIRGGHIILDNVTTINQVNLNDKSSDGKEIAGLGIVFFYEGPSSDTMLEIRNNLTQHNLIREDYNANSYANMLVTEVFGNEKYSSLWYKDADNVRWANTGILSLSEDVKEENIITQNQTNKENYTGLEVSYNLPGAMSASKGYLYTAKSSAPAGDYEYDSNTNYEVIPIVEFDHTVNAKVQEEGSETSCTHDPLTHTESITFANGDNFIWNTKILRCKNKEIEYTVWMDDKQVGDTVEFEESGTHTITFKYTDSNNYRRNEKGELVKYTKEYETSMSVIVTEKAEAAKNAKITFPLLDSYGTLKKTVDGKTYIMPDLTGTNIPKYGDDLDFDTKTRNYGSLKADGRANEDIYYPIIKTEISGNYMVFPVFGNKNGTLVQIQDYADAGAGAELTPYNASTQTLPTGLSVSRGYTVQWSTDKDVVGSGSMSYGNWTSGLLAFKYQSSSDDIACKVMSNYLSYYPNINLRSNDRNEQVMVAEYKYVDNKGDTYYYCVGYHIEKRNSGYNFGETVPESSGGCVTPDTLITLANGKQVRVDALTGNEQLLVWNMETGKLDSAPIMFVDSDPEAEFEIIHLYFSDGTDVKVISEHGFWDYDLNRYVYLDRYADKYIGHTFAKQSGSKLAKVKLTDVVLETELTTAWSPVTAGHLCYFVNGMLSMPGGVGGLFNIFDVDPATMTYDYEAMAKDIEAYGLFTYEEMNAMVPLSEDMFNAAGGAYLKISIGKGNMTLDDLVNMIQRYSKYI